MFHNGEPVTAEDVKFSFERYRGAAHALMKERVAGVDVPDPQHVRFNLKDPWPDFLTFYPRPAAPAGSCRRSMSRRSAMTASRRRRSAPAPISSSRSRPASSWCWRRSSSTGASRRAVKRLVMRVIPDEATRLAALKRGEVDIAYSIRAELAEELLRTPGLTLKPTVIQSPFWLYFADQWDPKSPWHDQRVRQAASLAIDRKTINQALTLGHSLITGSIIPESFEFYWKPPAPVYDPGKAKQLLGDAGFPNGFDAGFYTCDISYGNLAEAVLNNLGQVGIRAKLRPLERAAFYKGYGDKTFKNIVQGSAAARSATRRPGCEEFVVKGGAYRYGSYPDIDAMYPTQAVEGDHGKREAILHKMQQMVHEKRDLRADLAARVHQRRGTAGGRIELRPHPGLSLHGTV